VEDFIVICCRGQGTLGSFDQSCRVYVRG